MTIEIRPLVEADAPAAHALRHEAFGNPRIPAGQPVALPVGQRRYGAFDADRLVALLAVKAYASFFGGVPLPTAGMGGVTVAAEYRGRGLLRPLFERGMADSVAAGDVVSTMYPTANGLYRRFGYETIAERIAARVPVAALSRLRVPPSVILRRGAVADMPAVRECYTRWAREQNGPLTRTGPMFTATDQAMHDDPTGFTLAERDGAVTGFVSWRRSPGYGDFAQLDVDDLIADDADSLVALLAMLGSFGSVAGSVTFQTSDPDPIRTVLPSADWSVGVRNCYMMRVLRLAEAVESREWAPGLDVAASFTLHDENLPANSGHWRLALADGRARLEGGQAGGPVFTAAGFAQLYAGAATCATLRRTGGLSGDAGQDRLLEAAFAGFQPHIRDYF